MRKSNNIKRVIFGSIFGALLLIGTTIAAVAQNQTREYRDWQNAQARAEREHNDYLRTNSPSDYRQWKDAERLAQIQYRQYQQAMNRNNIGYNRGYNNDRNDDNRSGGMYRIYRNGSYYSTDSRGAELLKTAVRNGYGQGYRQGQIDRQSRRRYDFGNVSVYRSGNYGYQSYVARDQYQYYFQQGFERGYEDGFYSRNRYGSRSGNTFSILGSVIDSIINISR